MGWRLDGSGTMGQSDASRTRSGVAAWILLCIHLFLVVTLAGYVWWAGLQHGAGLPWVGYWVTLCLLLAGAPRQPLLGVAVFALVAYGISSDAPELDISLSIRVLDGIAAVALSGWWLSKRSAPKDVVISSSPVVLVGIVLLGWVALSVAVSLLSGLPWGPYLRHDPSNFGQATVMFLIVADGVRCRRDSLLLALLLCLTVVCRMALQGPKGAYLESYIATLLVIALPVALLGGRLAENLALKGLFGVVLSAMLYVLFLTQNRAGAVAVLAICLGVAWQLRHNWRRLLLGMAVLVAVSLAALPTSYLDRFKALVDPGATHGTAQLDRSSARERVELWTAGWKMALKHPMVGVGPGNYPSFLNVEHPELGPMAAHSNYVNILAETGFPGLVLYFLFFMATLRTLERTSRAAHRAWLSDSARMLQLALIAYLAGGLFNSRHDLVLAYIVAGWAVALSFAVRREASAAGHETKAQIAD